MNAEQIFSLALGLQSPWKISNLNFKVENNKRVLVIEIACERDHISFKNPEGKSNIYDHNLRRWRHLNFFEHECYIECNVPRVIKEDGKVATIDVPWARSGSGFTLLFEAFSMLLIENEMPINKVGEVMSEYPKRIWTIFNYWIGIGYLEADHSEITKLGIDETSSKKGHDYITVAVDMDKGRVIHCTEGKGADTITEIATYLESKGSEKIKIEQVCIDLSPSFISGVMNEFKKAAIIFDRFHVKQLLNKAMDTLRKIEYRTHYELKGHKYLFLKANKNLSKEQKRQRNELIELLPNIGEAYRLKLLFDDFWLMTDEEEAKGFLAYWCDLVYESKIQPMMKFANTVLAHWTGIVNYTKYRVSNGILEGINSKIQLAKRRARGYRNKTNFINMIYYIAGKLKFDYPQYLT